MIEAVNKPSTDKSKTSSPVIHTLDEPNRAGKSKQPKLPLHFRLKSLVPEQLRGRKLVGLHSLFTKGRKDKEATNIPYLNLDIIFEVAKYLNPVDYTVLRYACRDYYYMLPPTSERLMADYCGRTHLLSRLVDSNLLPKIYLKHGGLPLTRPLSNDDVKKMLYWQFIRKCQLCNRLSFEDCFDMCPLHRRFDPRPKLPADRTELEFAILFFGWFRGMGFRRIRTREAYYRFLEKVADTASSSGRSLAYDEGSFPDAWLEYAYSTNLNGPSIPRKTREIIKLRSCCHCLTVIREDSDTKECPSCDCKLCGSAPVEILRIRAGSIEDGEKSVYYVPLGVMREREASAPLIRRLREWTSRGFSALSAHLSDS